MNKHLKYLYILILILLPFGLIGGCGSNPPFAPFGSTITILNPPGDIGIPPNSITTITVEAIVLDPEGFPLNDVRVFWDLSFAGTNDLVFDTNGDGVADTPGLQLIDPDACGDITCELVPLSQLSDMGAFVDSPYETLTDDLGISTIAILISGNVIIDPASLTVSTQSGAVDVAEFGVNN